MSKVYEEVATIGEQAEKLFHDKARRYADTYHGTKYELGSDSGRNALHVAFMSGAAAMLHEILLHLHEKSLSEVLDETIKDVKGVKDGLDG
jgi:hypothetical protein